MVVILILIHLVLSDYTCFLWSNYFFSDLNAGSTKFLSKPHPLKSSKNINAQLKTIKFQENDQINICFDFNKSVVYAKRYQMIVKKNINNDINIDKKSSQSHDQSQPRPLKIGKKVGTIIGGDYAHVTSFKNGQFKLDFDKFYYLLTIGSARQGQKNMGKHKGFVFEIELLDASC